ncbi:MAG: hypothetical protein LQ352_008051 [Teloschistes flavicans]|nr:MAG: hypothetical protein LQ352_008051 [Teloschistes flavicans]
MFKEDPRIPDPDETKPPQEQQPGVTDIEGRPPAPPGATTDEQDYQAATSGEGLEMIGGRTGWWEKAWDEQFQFKGFLPSTPNREPAAVRRAIERALVEELSQKAQSLEDPAIGAIQQFTVREEEREIILEMKSKKYGIRFSPDLKEMKAFQQPQEEMFAADRDTAGEDTSMDPVSSQAESDEWASINDTPTTSQDDADNAQMNQLSRGADLDTVPSDLTTGHIDPEEESFSNPEEDVEPETEETWDDPVLVGNIIFREPEFKFKVLKRVMELTGIRIPDPVIQSIKSTESLHNRLIAQPPPKKLAQVLTEGLKPSRRLMGNMQQREGLTLLASLPNVKIHLSKRVPEMAEGALGRQKIIERELDKHGIPVPFKDVMEHITASEQERLRQNRIFLDQEDQEEIDVDALEEPDAEIRWPEEEVREQRAQQAV